MINKLDGIIYFKHDEDWVRDRFQAFLRKKLVKTKEFKNELEVTTIKKYTFRSAKTQLTEIFMLLFTTMGVVQDQMMYPLIGTMKEILMRNLKSYQILIMN